MRLTRQRQGPAGPADDSRLYQAVGAEIQQRLAWTYFYPALESGGEFVAQFPWNEAADFDRRFLRSYASTALVYPQQAAAEGTLHEVEYISPQTLEAATQPVFLAGYVFSRDDAAADWQAACQALQFGGERSYGWGDTRLESLAEMPAGSRLFGDAATVDDLSGERPVVRVEAGGRVPAHVQPAGERVAGPVEPLVGREWRSHNARNRHSGAHVEYSGVYLMPGATARAATRFAIGPFGIWQAVG
jgi:hypothetical protein